MYKSCVSYVALEQLNLSIQNQPATEAYNFIHRILDLLGRITFNVKAHLDGFNKEFKRSELRFYHESKHFAYANLVKTKYFDKDLMVPIPSGMKVPYLQAVNTIDALFKQLDIQSTVDILITYFKAETAEKPKDITNKISKLTKEQLEKELRVVFSSEKTTDVKLHTVISNIQDVFIVDKKILDLEPEFKQVETTCQKLGILEKLIDDVVTKLEKDATLDYVYVRSLQVLVRTAAFQFDAYGVLLAEAQRIEHNFVILLNKLVTEAAR